MINIVFFVDNVHIYIYLYVTIYMCIMFILMKLVSYGSATTQKIYWSVAITQVLVYNLYPFEIRS